MFESFFRNIANTFSSIIPKVETPIIEPESETGKVLETARQLGEQVREKFGKPLGAGFEKAVEVIPQTTFRALEDISKTFSLIFPKEAERFVGEAEKEGVFPALEKQPLFGEAVKERIEKTPLGKVPFVAPVVGFAAEFLLPPFGAGKADDFYKAVAKTTEKSAVKNLLIKGVKNISDSEADNLAIKLAPVSDTKVIKSEIESFVKTKVAPIIPKEVEKVPLKEPRLAIKPTQTIADEAIKFARENPDSSLVAKEFRNPRTKELESGPKLFKRIGEAIRDGEINLDELPKLVKRYGLSADATSKLFEDAATFSGRTLQALSRVEKELRNLIPDFVVPERVPTLWEKFKSGYLAVDNFRRGLLVTQLATAMRNAISQAGRYSIGTTTDAMNGVISSLTGKGEGFIPFFEDIAAVLRKFERGNIEKLQKVLEKNPIESSRLYNTPVGDVALSNKITNTLNAFNRGQEYFFRNLILDAKLNASARLKRVSLENLAMDDVERAVSEALEWTFSKTPIRGSFGDAIMRAYRAMPPLTLVNPFPRFMSNSVKFLFDFSPAGLMSLFSSKSRAAIAGGDYNAISKAIIGTSVLGGALAIRANENLAGEKWYEIKVGDKRVDTRAFAPFSTYLFFAEVMLNGGENIRGSDWALAAIGINRVAGTGLALLDLIDNKITEKNAKNIVNGIVSSYIGGFTVPFVTIKDIIGNFRLEERTIKETREVPIIGGAIGNIPGLNELLPTKFSLFEDKPLQREQTLLRQLTGLTIITKSFIQKELDRMGKDIGDLVPKTGNLEANRIISKQVGVVLDQWNDLLETSEKYQAMDDSEKLEFLKELISASKSEAKGEVASDLAGVVFNEIKKEKPEKRKKVIESLRNKGLMTENILDYLLPMLEAQPLTR